MMTPVELDADPLSDQALTACIEYLAQLAIWVVKQGQGQVNLLMKDAALPWHAGTKL